MYSNGINTQLAEPMSYPMGGYILYIAPAKLDSEFRSINKSMLDKYTMAVAMMRDTNHKNNPYKDSGFDLYMPFHNGDVKIEPGETKIVGLGIKAELREIVKDPFYTDSEELLEAPRPYFLYPRSSIAKRGLIMANSVGIIDSGYRGELKAALHNITDKPVIIKPMERLVQICMPNLSTDYVVDIVDELSDTKRGSGGFGSTGN